jgi:hypothetical protein
MYLHLLEPSAPAGLVVADRGVDLWSNVRSRQGKTVVAARVLHRDSVHTQSQLWKIDAGDDAGVSTSLRSRGLHLATKDASKPNVFARGAKHMASVNGANSAALEGG